MKSIQNNMENSFRPEEKVETFDPIKFFVKYIKYWPYIFVSVSLALIAGYFINKSKAPVYQASSKFYINEEVGNTGILNLTGLGNSGAYGRIDSKMANQAVFLKSRTVAEKALDRLDFDVDYLEPGIFTNIELYKSSPIHVQVDWGHAQITGGHIKISWNDTKKF
jgi:tyrosine-protein kinase Etk/Wzc